MKKFVFIPLVCVLILALVAVRASASITFSPPDKRLDVGDSPGNSGSGSASICADDNGWIYVSWDDGRNNAENYDMYFNRSYNYGANWLDNDIRVDTDLPGAGNSYMWSRSITCDDNGHVYLAWIDERSGRASYPQDIFFNSSANHGQTWMENDKRLNRINQGIIPRGTMPEIACTQKGQVYVVWYDYRWGRNRIYLNYSHNYGQTWLDNDVHIDNLTEGPGDEFYCWYPDVACDESGHVYVVWETRNDQPRIGFRRSNDYGVTWQGQQKIDNYAGTDKWVLSPRIACDGKGNVYIAWEDYRYDNNNSRYTDIYFNYSHDYGATWGTNIRLTTGKLPGSSQSDDDSGSLWMNCDENGHVYVVWVDRRNGNADIYFNHSSNYGVTWQTPDTRLDTGTSPGYYISWHPTMACDNSGKVFVVWDDTRNGRRDIYMNYSTNYGSSWQTSDIRVDTDNAGYGESAWPMVATKNGLPFIVWDDLRNCSPPAPPSEKADIYFQSYTPAGLVVSVSPLYQTGLPSGTLNYTVTIKNEGSITDNYTLIARDNQGWNLTLSENRLENVGPGENKTSLLTLTIPDNAAYFTEDNITVVATSQAENTLNENASCIAQVVVWVNTGDLENASHVYSLLSANDGAVYAGTASGDDPWDSVGVVFKTTDEGTTWVPTASLGGLGVVGNIEAMIQTRGGTIDNNIVIGTAWEGKIFRSTNGGDNWIQVVDLPGVVEVDSLIQAANGDLYAGTHYSYGVDEARIYRSTNYGDNWQVVAASSIDGELSGCTTVECLIQASTGYFFCGTQPGHVWRADNGDNWYKVGDSSINFGGSYKIYSLLDASNGYIYAASRNPGNVYRSTDNGNTWTMVANGATELGGATRTDALYQASNSMIYVGTDVGKIYRSTDGDNWVLEINLPAGRVNAIVEGPDNYLYAGTSFNGDVFETKISGLGGSNINFLAGWNLVCFTGASESDTPSNLFPELNYLTDYVIYWWEAPGGPYHLQGPNEVFKDNLGYWVSTNKDEAYRTTGIEPASRDIHLIPGWNLVGFPVTNVNTTPSNKFTGLTYLTDYIIYHWTAPGGPYVLMGPSEVFENFLGYWVWIDTGKTITVP